MDLSGLKKKGEEIIFGAIKKTRRCHGDENYFETENFFGILDAKNGKLFVMFSRSRFYESLRELREG